MPPNRRVNQPGPARRRPKIAGSGRSIAPRTQETQAEPAADQQAATSPLEPAVEPQPAEPAAEAPRDEPAGEAAETKPRNTLQLAAALFVVVLVLIGIGSVIAKVALDSKVSNQAYVDNAATDEVKAAAENALTTITAYKFDDMDGWADRSREVLAENMRADLDKTVDVTKSAAQQSKTSTEAKVDPTGVTLLDGDHAEVLVFLTVSVTNDGVAAGSSSGPELARMAKVDGKWVLSEIVLQ